MKLTATREDFLAPLQSVIGVVERRQTMPVLANVLLAARDNKLNVTGTDLEVELVASTKASVQQAQAGLDQALANYEQGKANMELARITAERPDVLAHPRQRGDLVEDPAVRRRPPRLAAEVGEMREAQRAEPVVGGHDHDVSLQRHVGAAVPRARGRAGREPSAVDPDDQWSGRASPGGQVQIEFFGG